VESAEQPVRAIASERTSSLFMYVSYIEEYWHLTYGMKYRQVGHDTDDPGGG